MSTFKPRLGILIVLFLVFSQAENMSQTVAFPGAEGYGSFASGGRGGIVYPVTNLNDHGPGSFRYGIEELGEPRTIVFNVSGTIMLENRIKIQKSNVTIAGQTAPGDGITLARYPFLINANNVIVRFIRCRLGDQSGSDDDAVSINYGKNIILDHVSASWSIDETLSCQSESVDSLTVQWCMVTESLNDSHHAKGQHGYGGIIGSIRQSFHHNLYAHHKSRTPKVSWRRHCKVDFRNNVIYNWGSNNCYDGTSSYMNWANNYYKAGPATNSNVRKQIFDLSDENVGDYEMYETSLYAEGNYVDGYPAVSENNWNGGIKYNNGASETKNRAYDEHSFPLITEGSAEEIFPLVLDGAGASLVRDPIDIRIASEVKDGTAKYEGSKTGKPGLIDSQTDVGGWPELAVVHRGEDFDKDLDGMSDSWEIQNNLNPNDPEDRNDYSLDSEYTNLEVYLNWIIVKGGTTSLEDQAKIANVKCFPNPASNSFTIDLINMAEPIVRMYTFNGKLLFEQRVEKHNNKVQIDGLQPGNYIVNVLGNNHEVLIEKVVIQ